MFPLKNKVALRKSEQKLESHLRGTAILLFTNKFTRDELRSEHLHLFNGKKVLNDEEANRQHDLQITSSYCLDQACEEAAGLSLMTLLGSFPFNTLAPHYEVTLL